MRKALTMLGAIAALALGSLFTASTANAQAVGSAITDSIGVSCQAYKTGDGAADQYPGAYADSPTNSKTYFYDCTSGPAGYRIGNLQDADIVNRDKMRLRGVTFYYFANPDQAKHWLLEKKSITLSNGEWKGATGFSRDADRISVVYEQYYASDTATTLTNLSEQPQRNGVANHEAGHQADYANGNPAISNYFKDLMTQDINYYNDQTRNDKYQFCFLYSAKCKNGKPIKPYNKKKLYPVATRNFKVLQDKDMYKHWFLPDGAMWKELFAEEFAKISAPGTDPGLDGYISYFRCTMWYSNYFFKYGATGSSPSPTMPGNNKPNYCVDPVSKGIPAP